MELYREKIPEKTEELIALYRSLIDTVVDAESAKPQLTKAVVARVIARKFCDKSLGALSPDDETLVADVVFQVAVEDLQIQSARLRFLVNNSEHPDPDGVAREVSRFFEANGLLETGLPRYEQILTDYQNPSPNLSDKNYAQPCVHEEVKPIMDMLKNPADTEPEVVLSVWSGGTKLGSALGENTIGGSFKPEQRDCTLRQGNEQSENSNEFWSLFISDETIDALIAKAETTDMVGVVFTPAFALTGDGEKAVIRHTSGKHEVPGFAPKNEEQRAQWESEGLLDDQLTVHQSLLDFFRFKNVPEPIMAKIVIAICPNDTIAAGGEIKGTGGNKSMSHINMESGQYRGHTPSVVDKLVSQRVDDPIINFEWMTCGKYLDQYLEVYSELMLGADHSLPVKLKKLTKKTKDILASSLHFDPELDVEALLQGDENGVDFPLTEDEIVFLREVSRGIMERMVEADARMNVVKVAYYESLPGVEKAEQHETIVDGSVGLYTPGLIEEIEQRSQELEPRITIRRFDIGSAVEPQGTFEEPVDATGKGGADFATAALKLHRASTD